MDSISLLVVVAAAVALLWLKKIVFPSVHPGLQAMPGPPSKPFTGNFLEIHGGETGAAYLKWAKEYGGIYRFKWLWFDRIIVSDPQLVKQVLLEPTAYNKNTLIYRRLASALGEGVLTIPDEDIHKRQRSIMTPAFAYRHLKGLAPIFTQKGQMLVSQWLQKSPTEPVNVRIGLSKATSDVIGEAGFGYKIDSLSGKNAFSIYELFKLLLPQNFGLVNIIPYVREIMPAAFRQRAAINALNQNVEQILQNKVQQKETTKKTQNTLTSLDEREGGATRDNRDILDILLDCKNEYGEALSHDELIAQTKTVLLAGYETSSTALVWTLYTLAQHPKIQDKLAEEVIALLGKDRAPTADEADGLPYLDRVVKEMLRFRPPVPIVYRNTENDITLGDYRIPKQTNVGISIYLMHHNPLYWKNPEVFNPDRWLDVSDESKFSGSYIPFLMGVRNCIGSKFALVEIKILLTMIVQKLRFSLVPGQTIKRGSRVTMLPQPDVLLYLSKR